MKRNKIPLKNLRITEKPSKFKLDMKHSKQKKKENVKKNNPVNYDTNDHQELKLK